VDNEPDNANGVYTASWVLLTRNKKFLEQEDVASEITEWTRKEGPIRRVWTDDYYNLAEVVDWGMAWREVRMFPFEFADKIGEKYTEYTKKLREEMQQANANRRREEEFMPDVWRKFEELENVKPDQWPKEARGKLAELSSYFEELKDVADINLSSEERERLKRMRIFFNEPEPKKSKRQANAD
jgi:hypothetical protein